MQFKVPQKIDLEDKIIGPLTMKQFIYLLVGGMITYATIKSGNFGFIIFLGVPAGLLALSLAFVKIQDQPFSKFLISLLMYMFNPKKRYWQKDWQKEGAGKPIVQKVVEKPLEKTIGNEVERKELKRLAATLDRKEQKIPIK